MGNDAHKNKVDDALSAIGFGKYQFLLLVYAGMGFISEAMEMMLLSFIGPAVRAEWGLTPNEESMMTSVVFVGMLIGAYSCGVISDRYGRRKGFFIPAIITSGAGFCSALAPTYATLIICRFFVGIGLGGGHVLLSWFLEFIPAPSRGTWVSISSAFWSIGTVLEALLAWNVMPSLGWRWLLVLSAIPSSSLLIFYSKTPESPRYLLMRGRTNDAMQVLDRIAEMNQTSVSNYKVEKATNLSSEDAQLLSASKGSDGTHGLSACHKRQRVSVFTLLMPKLLRSTLLLWVVFFGFAFSYYGLVLLTTELSSGKTECSPGQWQATKTAAVSYRNVFITSLAEFPGKILSAAMADKLGRKGSMATMCFLCCFFLVPVALNQSEDFVAPFLFGARICVTATSTIIYIYASEIYPTAIRTTGVGVASSVGRFGGMLCPLVAVSLVHNCHQTTAILLFQAVIFISAVCVLLFPFETKGRALSDDVSDLNKGGELT